MKPKSKYLTYLSLIILMSLWFNACKVGPKFEQPEVDTPKNYRAVENADSSQVDMKWWELFDDPTLNNLVKVALENNKDLLIAASKVEQSRYNLGYNRADMYPKFNVAGGTISGNYGGGLLQFDDAQKVFYGNAQVAWELDFWGKYRRGNEAARAEMMASEYNLQSVQITLISEVASTYFLLLDMYTRYEISQNTFASRDSGLNIIQARYNSGIIHELDLNQAQIQKSIAEAYVPIYKRQLKFAENNLNMLLGQNIDSIIVSSTLFEQKIPPEIPVGLPSELLERRPDLLSSAERLHAQTAKIGVAQAYRFPSISLTGLFGSVGQDLSTFGADGLAWNAAAGLTAPLFQFNKNKRRVQIEREKTEQALLQYEKDILTAFKEVEDALINIQTLKLELKANLDQKKAAVNSQKLSFQRYYQGVTSYLEVLETQRSAFSAQLQYSETYQKLLDAYISLFKALGGGWLSVEEMNDSQENEQ